MSIHIVNQDGLIISPFLTKNTGRYKTGDTLIIEDSKGQQTIYTIDFVASEKVNKGWVYLALHGPQGLPVQVVDDVPAYLFNSSAANKE
jgi:hypothetical protein